MTYEIQKEVPSNINQLRLKANNQSSWRERLSAVEELKKFDCQQSKDILTRLALHDIVFQVKEAAFRATQRFNVQKQGKPLYLGKKPKGNLIKGINKMLAKVKKSLPQESTFEAFKEKFSTMYPEAYDAYEGDRGNRFEEWLRNVIGSLPNE